MGYIRDDMLGGLKQFFADQAEVEGTCLVDYSQFDTHYEEVFTDTLVAVAVPVLEPRGRTALLDALGQKITDLDTKLSALKPRKRPDKVLVIVVTDGQENASKFYTKDRVKWLVEHFQASHGWDFVFLGANMDAVAEAAKMGFHSSSSITYNTQFAGATMDTLSGYTTRSRTSATPASFSDADRLRATTGESS
jgi:hypothetical protein